MLLRCFPHSCSSGDTQAQFCKSVVCRFKKCEEECVEEEKKKEREGEEERRG